MAALVAAAVAIALLPNCTEGCTELGCGPAFTIELDEGVFAGGDYQMVVTSDGVTTSCTVTLPIASCPDGFSCDRPDPGFFIELNDCGGTLERLEAIVFHTQAPAQIDVEVSKAGTVLGSDSFQPAYTTSQPNGPDCEPTCKQTQAAVTLDLDWEQI